MKVFLSWSGEKSKAAAMALHGWLPTVIQTVKPYMSAENIDKGERWSVDIAKQLEETHFGIICVTPDNKSAPWVLFEAGALSKSIERGRVSPLLFGISASDFTGSPLLQFQFTSFRKDDFLKLLQSINASAPDLERLAADVLNRSFDRAWQELEQEIKSIDFGSTASDATSNGQEAHPDKLNAVLEELLDIARTQLKVIKDPQELLPPEYLGHILRRNRSSNSIPHAVLMDLEKGLAACNRHLNSDGEVSETQKRLLKKSVERHLEPAINYLVRSVDRIDRVRFTKFNMVDDVADKDGPDNGSD